MSHTDPRPHRVTSGVMGDNRGGNELEAWERIVVTVLI